MNRGAFNLIIFGSLILVVAVVVNKHYAGIRSDLETNWGV